MSNKFKGWGINLCRTLFLDWFNKHYDKLEIVGDQIGRMAGETVEVICSTNSKETIDQENSRQAKPSMLQRLADGFNLRIKKIIQGWEKDLKE